MASRVIFRGQVAVVAVLALVLPARADAHRLDEYLQATRVSVDADRIGLEIDLSPGVSVADRVIATIDVNGDGRLDGGEADAYAHAVLRALSLSVDGRAVSPRLDGRAFPSVDDMRAGAGTIRLVASAPVPRGTGRRRLVYSNAWQPGMSMYLVNALVPSDRRVRLDTQQRDEWQRTFTLDYDVSGGRAWAGWSGTALAMIGVLVVVRRRSVLRGPAEAGPHVM